MLKYFRYFAILLLIHAANLYAQNTDTVVQRDIVSGRAYWFSNDSGNRVAALKGTYSSSKEKKKAAIDSANTIPRIMFV